MYISLFFVAKTLNGQQNYEKHYVLLPVHIHSWEGVFVLRYHVTLHHS